MMTERMALDMAAWASSASAAAIVMISIPPNDVITASSPTAMPPMCLGAKPPCPKTLVQMGSCPGSGPRTSERPTSTTPTTRKATMATTFTMDSHASTSP